MSLIAPAATARRPFSSLRFGADLGASAWLADPKTDIVVVPRQLSLGLQEEAAKRCGFGPVFRLRYEFAVDALDADTVGGLFEPLADGPLRQQVRRDVPALARCWAELTGRRHAQATLTLVDTDECGKLHCDYIDLRILCTYDGPGTWLAPEHAIDREAYARGRGKGAVEANAGVCPDPGLLVQASAGDVVFLKGKSWRDGARGAIHRSPTIQGTGRRRLVLKVDGMGCGC